MILAVPDTPPGPSSVVCARLRACVGVQTDLNLIDTAGASGIENRVLELNCDRLGAVPAGFNLECISGLWPETTVSKRL